MLWTRRLYASRVCNPPISIMRGMLISWLLPEHKARRDNMDKLTSVPPNFDAFFSFPHGKGGYSGTCTYVKSSYAVPVKAEEGITGLLLGTSGMNSSVPKLVYGRDERIGSYPDEDEIKVEGNLDGSGFDMRKLDMEGRSVVLDFGYVVDQKLSTSQEAEHTQCPSFFVIFNLYCPNETNDSRLPYKLNFLRYLQARVDSLIRAGRNVIILGDINVCHRPIDNGEGGIQRQADEHYNHPARRWFDDWVAPKGGMHDVTRECWPERKGMFTCEWPADTLRILHLHFAACRLEYQARRPVSRATRNFN